MSDTVLSGRWVVYYEAENRQKRVYRDTAVEPTATDTVRQLYSALQNLFDEVTQMDDGTPMKYQTPTEYTVGIIDAGDDDPWFIDRTSVEYLTGGAIATASWTRVQDSNTGIIRVPRTGTNIVAADIGFDIVGDADGDSGTLLDVQGTTLWIRPDSDGIGDSFDNNSQTLTCNGNTDTQNGDPETGESLWANIYSLGTIEDNTHLYIYQNGALVTAYSAATDWWVDGHIDILINVKEVDVESDEGYITVMGRQYSKSYSFFQVDLSSGGRNPIPLQTGDDLDNTTGYRRMVLTDASDDFTVGEVIEDNDNSNIQGVVTASEGTVPNITLDYYLIGDPQDDFTGATGAFTGATSAASGTAVAPSDIGPASGWGLSIVHASNETFDIDEDGTTENYSIVIDCNDTALTDVYEWVKYITRRGDTTSGYTDYIEGEQYLGSDYRVTYASIQGSLAEGDVVTQSGTLATGTIVAHNETDNILILRNSRGTFNSSDVIGDGPNYVSTPVSTAVTPIGASPFGTFAGGKFFCAPGVVLDNVLDADLNNYQLVDDGGNVVLAPVKVTISIGNTRLGDKIAVFRLTGVGGTIEKDTYNIDATQGAAESEAIAISGALAVDEVGKTAGGVVRVVDIGAEIEDRYRFTGWVSGTPSTVSLAAQTATADAGGDVNTLIDADGDFVNSGILIGDVVYNVTDDTYGYVTVVAAGQLTTTNTGSDKPVATWASKQYGINVAVRQYAGDDNVYIPFIDVYETVGAAPTGGTETALVVYNGDIPVRVRARQAGDIVPYEADALVESTGLSNNIIRSADTVYT